MKVVVDYPKGNTTTIGERMVKELPRYYYDLSQYPDILLVTQQKSLEALKGKLAIVLFGEANPDLVADLTYGIRKMEIQATVKQVPKLPYGKPVLLSEAIERWLYRDMEEGLKERR